MDDVLKHVANVAAYRIIQKPYEKYWYDGNIYHVTPLRWEIYNIWLGCGDDAEVITPRIWKAINEELKPTGYKLCIWVEKGKGRYLAMTKRDNKMKKVVPSKGSYVRVRRAYGG